MAFDRLDDEKDAQPPSVDACVVHEADDADTLAAPSEQADSAVRTSRIAEYRAIVDAVYQAYAIEESAPV